MTAKELIKTIYTIDVYSNRGVDTYNIETLYKPLWQVKQELENRYRNMYKVKGSIILEVINMQEVYN